ncbi:MAG TPA: hypothetical protein VHW00_18235 [Thermoanaerobaculia bacterium]|nr:hypothetical protein [Thermoanaerobaculia bacterium]
MIEQEDVTTQTNPAAMRAITMLLTPWPARRATLFVLLGGLIVFVWLARSDALLHAEWRVDEGQRIAESYALRLVEEGEFGHPDWFRYPTDSSHPQMSKYYFGLALQLAGVELPRDLALPRYYESGGIARTGWAPPPHLRSIYEPMLVPARRAALLCNVISAMVVVWLLLRWCGAGAALLAGVVFARHYLMATYVSYARSDALQTCAMTLTLLPLASLWRNSRSRGAYAAAAVAGVLAAICFQTRLNGLLCLGAAGLVLIVLALRDRDVRPLVLAAIVVFVCVAVSLVSNPFYWAQPSRVDGLPVIYQRHEPLALRVMTRFHAQMQELRMLMKEFGPSTLRSLAERGRFTARVLFSGVAGKVILGGILAGALAAFFRRPPHAVFAWLWGLSALVVFALWIPLAWDPYVLLIFPSIVLMAAVGWSLLAASFAKR